MRNDALVHSDMWQWIGCLLCWSVLNVSVLQQLHNVSAVDESGAVTITATLKEKADLYGANGKHADSYDNPYTVEYSVVEDGGHWKIIDALVLGE